MLFTSYTYLAFLALAVALVRVVRGNARELLLLAASLIFYAAWDVRFLVLLLGLGVATYFAGRLLAEKRAPRGFLGFAVGAILAVLAVFKYSAMLAALVAHVLPGAPLRLPAIVLPLGISFYTFECVSYLLDVAKGGPELRPLHRFLLLPAFWPHLVAGPILRARELKPQLERLATPSAADCVAGFDRVLFGLLKKAVLANALAAFVDRELARGPHPTSAPDAWVLAIGFGLQIYFDFSAYTDIAIGSARMVGFTLPENFDLPYHAGSPTEFWNRWHMTLSRWVRDYLFFPLNLRAGRRVWLRYLVLVSVMALVGLWHGAGLGFVLWGAWHGSAMAVHRLLQARVKQWPARALALARGAGAIATFLATNAAWILFRAPTLGFARGLLASMLMPRDFRTVYPYGDYAMVAGFLLFYFLLEPRLQRLVRYPETGAIAAERLGFWLRPLAYGGCLMLLFMFDQANASFIYFQF